MVVRIYKDKSDNIVLQNEIGNVKFNKNGVYETYDTVSYTDENSETLITFKKNRIYTLPILRVALVGSTAETSITFGFDGYTNGSGLAFSVPYSDVLKKMFMLIPFKVKAVRCTTIQSQKIDATERTTFLNGENLVGPIIKHTGEDIIAGTMTTAPIANFSTKPTNTQERYTIKFQNASSSVFTYYEFVADISYES